MYQTRHTLHKHCKTLWEGLTWVDGRVCLNDVTNHVTRDALHLTPQATDDACSGQGQQGAQGVTMTYSVETLF